MIDAIAATLVRITLAITLGVAFLAKLRDVPGFLDSVRGFSFVPGPLVLPVAIAVLLLEIASAVSLVLGFALEWGMILASALFAGFSLAAAFTLRRQGPIPCGCLGRLAETRLGWHSVWTNTLLSVAGLAAAFAPHLSVPGPPGERTGVRTSIALWGTGACLAFLYWVSAYAYSVNSFVREAIDQRAQGEHA